jgi:hypothetical protein
LSEIGDALGGHDGARLEEYLEVVDERCAVCYHSISLLVNTHQWEHDKVTLPLNSHGELDDGSQSYKEARWKLKLHSGVNS